jgi:lipopolysaccharide/colanic/teichoic acid biosynthesis glycosyltransferase
VTRIVRRVRTTDQIGMFERMRVGIILPDTDAEGASKLAEDLVIPLQSSGIDISYDIHRYPSLPDQSNNGSNKGHRSTYPKAVQDSKEGVSPIESRCPDVTARCSKTLAPPFTCPWRLKRALDILGSLLALIILSPIMLLAATAIFVVSPGPVIFRQQRLGFLRKSFTIYKFRTMRLNCEQSGHQQYVTALIQGDRPLIKLDTQDPRLIPLGSLLRKCFIDELPQLFNVLVGDMSLVGPRPCLPFEATGFAPWQNGRFNVLPGMTGLWQTRGKENTTFLRMLRYDVAYSHAPTVWLDLRILLRTLPAILSSVGILNMLGLRLETKLGTIPEVRRAQRRA